MSSIFVDLKDIDSYNQSAERMTEEMERGKKDVDEVRNVLIKKVATIEKNVQDAIKTIEDDIKLASEAIEHNTIVLEHLHQRLESLESELVGARQRLDSALSDLSSARSMSASTEEEREARSSAISSAESSVSSASAEVNRIQNEINQVKQRIAIVEDAIMHLEAIIKNAQVERENAIKVLNFVKDQYEQFSIQEENFNKIYEDLKQKIWNYRSYAEKAHERIKSALNLFAEATNKPSLKQVDVSDTRAIENTANLLIETKKNVEDFCERQKVSGDLFASTMGDDISMVTAQTIGEIGVECAELTKNFDEIAELLRQAKSCLDGYYALKDSI